MENIMPSQLHFEPLLAWYGQNARSLPWRETRDPYAIWVSEVMLQQTRVEAVRGYYARFLAAFPTVSALAEAPEERLLKLWEGLGYYSRARNLQRAAREMVLSHGGQLPGTYEQLIALPGIGDYTAGAIASIAFSCPVPAVDGNVLRVMARLKNDPEDILDPAVKKRVRAELAATMPKDTPGTFNQAMMELGATVCLPNGIPLCDGCPMQAQCAARTAGTERELPTRLGKKTRRVEEKTVFALFVDAKPLIYKRPETGLLAGLWQLPDVPGHLSMEEAMAYLDARGIRPLSEVSVYARRHVFTHVEWQMQVIRADVEAPCLPGGWHPEDPGQDALPTAYRCCL